METKTVIIWCLAALLAIIDIASTLDDKEDAGLSSDLSMRKRSDPDTDLTDSYDFSDEDLYELAKRGSLLRFGKRGSLLRFGKRGSLFRFGKRGSLFRFGKRMDNFEDWPALEDLAAADDSESSGTDPSKRGQMYRFAKRPSLFRFGRSVNKGPHTPFRFGREEDE